MDQYLDESSLYFFTGFAEGAYQTLFVGWITAKLVSQFSEFKEGEGSAYIKVSVGEHTFINYIDGPLFLLNFNDNDIFEYAGDDYVLDLFPSGEIPENVDTDRMIDFPTFFEPEVENLIEYKLSDGLYAHKNGLWIPLEI